MPCFNIRRVPMLCRCKSKSFRSNVYGAIRYLKLQTFSGLIFKLKDSFYWMDDNVLRYKSLSSYYKYRTDSLLPWSIKLHCLPLLCLEGRCKCQSTSLMLSKNWKSVSSLIILIQMQTCFQYKLMQKIHEQEAAVIILVDSTLFFLEPDPILEQASLRCEHGFEIRIPWSHMLRSSVDITSRDGREGNQAFTSSLQRNEDALEHPEQESMTAGHKSLTAHPCCGIFVDG